tara:strand:+ start:104 stop:277 length:174 start_codon:yes stop_codon:yes gene_type:complete
MTEAMIIDQVKRLVEGKCTYESQMLLELMRMVREKDAEIAILKYNAERTSERMESRQ